MCSFFTYRAISKTGIPESELLIQAMHKYSEEESEYVDGGDSDSSPSAVPLPKRLKRDGKKLEFYYRELISPEMRDFDDVLIHLPDRLRKYIILRYD